MQYRQLLLSSGGGIVSTNQMDAQSPCATVAIGLGGTGISALRNLKRQVYSRLQPDDATAVIPSYRHIKFLAIDTDGNSLDADGQIYDLNEATEFFDISSGNIQGLLAQTTVLSDKPKYAWLKTRDVENGQQGLSILSATAGAGGVRQIGRLLLIEKSLALVEKIGQLVNEAKIGLPGGSDVNIHIFTGMGGGTGAGTFLDVCYLVQKALQNIGEWGHALTCGYFFLPDVNLSKPEIANNPAVSEYIKVNGFASMKELDYCMNFQNNHGSWDQEYRTFHIGPTSEPPVKLCHIISSATTGGALMDNGYTYAMNVVTNYVMQFLVQSQGFTLQSHIANFFAEMGNVKKEHGANYGYCVLGASHASVPMREITTYLGSKLFERMACISEQLPTDAEVEKFASDNGLTHAALLKSILDKTSYQMPLLQMDYKMFTNMSEDDLALPDEVHLPDAILGSYRQLEQKMVGRVQTNKQALLHEWKKENLKEEVDSVSKMCRIYYALASVVADGSKGPLYAAALLKGTGRRNLVDLLRGALAETQDAIKKNNSDMTLRFDAIKKARTTFLHPGAFNLTSKAKLFESFMQTVQQYLTLKNRILVLEELQSMILTMIGQFTDLYEKHFKIYAQLSENLIETFHENYRFLEAGGKAVQDPFVMPLMTIADLKDSLDKTVEEMKLELELQELHSKMFEAFDVWLNGDESKITKYVSLYLTERFKGYTEKTLTNYLEIKFDTTDPQQLTDKIYREIMMPLSDKATPLFWLSGAFQITDAAPLGYCSIPDSAAVIIAAANDLKVARQEFQVNANKVTDRITLMRCTCGVPMFGYNGIESYSQLYSGDVSIGKHLYEETMRDARDWRLLPDLAPFSTINTPNQQLKDAAQDYDKAVEEKVINVSANNVNDYLLLIYPELTEIEATVKAALETNKIGEIKKAKSALEEYKANRQPARRIAIPNDGADSHKDKVRKDHVIAAREMMQMIRSELAKNAQLVEMGTKLDNAVGALETQGNLREEFYNAMMCGVFTYKIPTVLYTKEVFGMTEEITLSEPKAEPYGKVVPLYQAFLAYSAMSKEERDEVVNACDERMGMLDPALKAACDNLRTVFNPQYMGMQQRMLQRAEQDEAKVKEIVQFLLAFRQGIDDFCGMYGLM